MALYENTLLQFMREVRQIKRAPYESAAAPTSQSATDRAKFNAVCHSKPMRWHFHEKWLFIHCFQIELEFRSIDFYGGREKKKRQEKPN